MPPSDAVRLARLVLQSPLYAEDREVREVADRLLARPADSTTTPRPAGPDCDHYALTRVALVRGETRHVGFADMWSCDECHSIFDLAPASPSSASRPDPDITLLWQMLGAWIGDVARPSADMAPTTAFVDLVKRIESRLVAPSSPGAPVDDRGVWAVMSSYGWNLDSFAAIAEELERLSCLARIEGFKDIVHSRAVESGEVSTCEGCVGAVPEHECAASPPAGTGGERDVRYTVTPIVGSELTRWAVCDQHEVRFVGQCNSESQAKALADMLNATPASRSGGPEVTPEMVDRVSGDLPGLDRLAHNAWRRQSDAFELDDATSKNGDQDAVRRAYEVARIADLTYRRAILTAALGGGSDAQ